MDLPHVTGEGGDKERGLIPMLSARQGAYKESGGSVDILGDVLGVTETPSRAETLVITVGSWCLPSTVSGTHGGSGGNE